MFKFCMVKVLVEEPWFCFGGSVLDGQAWRTRELEFSCLNKGEGFIFVCNNEEEDGNFPSMKKEKREGLGD